MAAAEAATTTAARVATTVAEAAAMTAEAAAAEPLAEVDVFAGFEAAVESADSLEHLAPHRQAAAAEPLHLGDALGAFAEAVVHLLHPRAVGRRVVGCADRRGVRP